MNMSINLHYFFQRMLRMYSVGKINILHMKLVRNIIIFAEGIPLLCLKGQSHEIF